MNWNYYQFLGNMFSLKRNFSETSLSPLKLGENIWEKLGENINHGFEERPRVW